MKPIIIEAGHAPVGSSNYAVSLAEIVPGIAIGKALARELSGKLVAYFDDFNPGNCKAYDAQKLLKLMGDYAGPIYQSQLKSTALSLIDELKFLKKKKIIELMESGKLLPVPLRVDPNVYESKEGIMLDEIPLTCKSSSKDYFGQKVIKHKPLCAATSAAWLLYKLEYNGSVNQSGQLEVSKSQKNVSVTVFPAAWAKVEEEAKYLLKKISVDNISDISVFFVHPEPEGFDKMYESGKIAIDLEKIIMTPSFEEVIKTVEALANENN